MAKQMFLRYLSFWDTLAPYLIILVLDYVMRVAFGEWWGLARLHCHAKKKPGGIPAKVIIDLDFANLDFKIGKVLPWKACNKMRTLWKSALPASLKISFFRAAYGAEGWTITNKLEARRDGCYTRLLIMVLDLNWKGLPTREEICGSLPKLSEVVRERRLNFATHRSRR